MSMHAASSHVLHHDAADSIIDSRDPLLASLLRRSIYSLRGGIHWWCASLASLIRASRCPGARGGACTRGERAPFPCVLHALPGSLSALAFRCCVCACTPQERLFFETVLLSCLRSLSMQKERPQSIKVHPRTAIERAPAPTAQPTCTLPEAS